MDTLMVLIIMGSEVMFTNQGYRSVLIEKGHRVRIEQIRLKSLKIKIFHREGEAKYKKMICIQILQYYKIIAITIEILLKTVRLYPN